MPSVIVHAVENSVLQGNAPSAADITAAMQSVNFGGGDWGAWVGPRPRITRRANIGSISGFQTDAAWLYTWPDDAFTQAHAQYQQQQLQSQVLQMLQPISSDFAVTLERYAPAVNGAASWWSSGAASITQTRDEFPTGAGRLDAGENPTGPTTDATHPSTVPGALGGFGSGLSGILWPLALIVAAIAATKVAPSRSTATTTTRKAPVIA